MPGDWDSNNTDTPGVVRRESDNVLHWHLSNAFFTGPFTTAGYGTPAQGFIPVAGDWNGDGSDSPGAFYTPTGQWHLSNSTASPGTSYTPFSWGNQNDLPMAGDLLVNNNDRPILWRPSEVGGVSVWFRNSGLPGSTTSFAWATDGDCPVVLNWDSDSLDEYAIVR